MNTEQRRTRQDVIDETTERMEAIARLKMRRPYLPDTKIAKELGLDRSTVSRLWLEYTYVRWIPVLRKITRSDIQDGKCTFTEDEMKMAREMTEWFTGLRNSTSTSTVRRADAAQDREKKEREWIRIGAEGENGTVICLLPGNISEHDDRIHIAVEARIEGHEPVYTVVNTWTPCVHVSAPKGRLSLTAMIVEDFGDTGTVVAEAAEDVSVMAGTENHVRLGFSGCNPYPFNTYGRKPTRAAARYLKALRKKKTEAR